MISTIKTGALFDDSSDRRSHQGQDEPGGEPGEEPPRPAPQLPKRDVRLVIEPDADGALSYKLIDRADGAVISIVSREDLLKMVSDPNYTAGALVSTSA
jgi:hypothetical protein